MDAVKAVEFKNVSRIYGSNRANDRLSFSVDAGSIHGLIGENGAGKSTAMKMLFGLEKPDEGEISVFGQPIHFSSATEAMSAGVAMVHQHFMLSENATALENFLLMRGKTKALAWRKPRKELLEAQQLSQNYGFEIPWMKPVRELSVGEQQRLEILKALSRKGRILILDEPTAVLTPSEIKDLFKKLRELKNRGYTVILITHKLKEVLEITDEVTILRQGQVTAQLKTAQVDAEILAEKMMGHALNKAFRKLDSDSSLNSDSNSLASSSLALASSDKNHENKKLILEKVKARKTDFTLDIASLEVRAGEIVGLAGVEGNGQKELVELLLHPQKFRSIEGQVEILGQKTKKFSTHQIRQLSMGVFPEDRLRWGAVSSMNLVENFLLGYHRKWHADKKILAWKELSKVVNEQIKKFNIKASGPKAAFSSLSGGNQQKLVAARELYSEPQLLVVSQPTRGVDIGAAEFIHQQLLTAAKNKNTAILLISSELDELLKLSDRILVIYRGSIQTQFSRSQYDENKIGAAMGGLEVSP